ncbi:MAG TPA: sigma-70 family RNA polymerase sigma factor [Acidimicrobiales bacterium]|nr:sigma-70 family RNA polymerase sigma factor [Acidimicrobiales bacterium]
MALFSQKGPRGGEVRYTNEGRPALQDVAVAAGPGNGAMSEAPGGGRPDDKTSAPQVTPITVVRHSSGPNKEEDPGTGAPPLDDARVEAAKRGDPSSWEAAYLAYGRALMGYLMVRLENRDDATDALSETFTRAIGRASSFRGDAYAFRSWLFTIARNVSTDQHRRRARVVPVPDYPELEDRGQPSGEDITVLNDDVVALRKGFSCLSKQDQELLWLRVCSGLSAAEVGEVIGKRPGAVRMQQMRALETLREQVPL